MPNFATSHGPRCLKTDVHNGLLIIIFCFLSFSGIHHASLAVATFADGHPPLLVVVALRHIGRISPVAVAHFASFSPTIPATISAAEAMRIADADSPNAMIPTTTPPTAPIPVHTA